MDWISQVIIFFYFFYPPASYATAVRSDQSFTVEFKKLEQNKAPPRALTIHNFKKFEETCFFYL